MTGGLIQLVANGIEDIYLTRDPEITFFKVVYRRHTNFSIEPIPQNFITPLDFGKKATCVISKRGDLINQIILVMTLPNIPEFIGKDKLKKFAWVRKIGLSMIKTIDIIIGDELIDRHYAEWLNIWYELIGPNDRGLDQMLGNIPELYDFSSFKNEYTIYVPLQFWFCRNSGSVLPLISLSYNEVKINVELNDADQCFLISPNHWIPVINDFVNFKPFEYIEQKVDDRVATGLFSHYDQINKRLYYLKTSNNDFQSVKTQNPVTMEIAINQSFDSQNIKYQILNKSGAIAIPAFNSVPQSYSSTNLVNISLGKCFLLVNYVFLDNDERITFLKNKHEYLIEHVLPLNKYTIENTNALLNIDLIGPCKFIVWTVQLKFLKTILHDNFNYTDNKTGKSLIIKETLLIDGQDRITLNEYEYYNYIEPYKYFPRAPSEGINVYSFSLFPDKFQPSGSSNMSYLNNFQIKLQLNPIISSANPSLFNGYALVYNVLQINKGVAGLVFIH